TQARALVRGQGGDIRVVEPYATAIRPQHTGNAVDQGSPARAVRPNQAQALPLLHLEAHISEGLEAPKALSDMLHRNQCGGHQARTRLTSRRKSPKRPSGARMTKATRTTPTINRFNSEEMVTVASCCAVPSSTAPTSGPTHVVVPPIMGMARLFTA